MTRKLPVPALAAFLLLAACSSSRPVVTVGTTCPPDPRTEPTVVAAVVEGASQAIENAERGAEIGHRVGVVAGVIAAVFGGSGTEDLDEVFDRYRRVHDTATIAGAVIGAATGAKDGAERGFELDRQFAELDAIEDLEVTRPATDLIDIRFLVAPSEDLLEQIAAVFVDRTDRMITIEGPGDTVLDVRDALIDLGVPASSLNAQRVDGMTDVVLRVRARG